MVARGLSEYGFEREARKLQVDTRDAIRESGFYEYFNPINGEGRGQPVCLDSSYLAGLGIADYRMSVQ